MVDITDDSFVEFDETFISTITTATAGGDNVPVGQQESEVTIVDNDGESL